MRGSLINSAFMNMPSAVHDPQAHGSDLKDTQPQGPVPRIGYCTPVLERGNSKPIIFVVHTVFDTFSSIAVNRVIDEKVVNFAVLYDRNTHYYKLVRMLLAAI